MYTLHDFTDEEYFNHPAVNRSTLWNMRKSAFHTQTKQPRTDALDVGTATHLVVLEGADAFSQIQESKTEQIEIDETVSEVVIIFKTSVNYHLGESDQRYVSVQLLWCDEFGSNCDTSNPIYEVMADNGSYPQETVEIDRDINQFDDGMWLLTVDGRGGGTNTGISTLDFEDSWLLRVRVVRPCLQFPESPTECTPLIDL